MVDKTTYEVQVSFYAVLFRELEVTHQDHFILERNFVILSTYRAYFKLISLEVLLCECRE